MLFAHLSTSKTNLKKTKTAKTIIECLKQVTTGELPPNTRSGQSFIHDPRVRRRRTFFRRNFSQKKTKRERERRKEKKAFSKCFSSLFSRRIKQRKKHFFQVSGNFDVKANIKLRFKAQTGQLTVASRAFQLTAKRARTAAGKAAAGGAGGGARGRGNTAAGGGGGGAGASSLSSVPMTLQFKTLDQTLQTIDPATHAKKSAQHRCADMDQFVPRLMG